MGVTRVALKLKAASSSVACGDTGQVVYGGIVQMHWIPTVGDTGADLNVTLVPNASGDTAGGITVFDKTDIMGTTFTRAPVQPLSSNDSFDTGVDMYAPYVAAGDRLRAKCQPGGSFAVDGVLHVWVYSG